MKVFNICSIKLRFATVMLALLVGWTLSAQAQDRPLPQGASLPGLGSLPGGFNGPGYLEVGGSHSNLTQNNSSWNDFYIRSLVSGGKNTLNLEADRESRWGDTGWYFLGGLTRVLNEDWYAQVNVGTSLPGGFFLPKFRVDGYINRKLLSRKQLVATVGVGLDKSKVQNHALRTSLGAAYYFDAPWVVQGGVTFTQSNPGGILASTEYLAFTQGHEKEHYVSVRGEFGREAYEIIGPASGLFNFPIRGVSGTWRQWIGFNWGVNATVDYYHTPFYRRAGATAGIFLDF